MNIEAYWYHSVLWPGVPIGKDFQLILGIALQLG